MLSNEFNVYIKRIVTFSFKTNVQILQKKQRMLYVVEKKWRSSESEDESQEQASFFPLHQNKCVLYIAFKNNLIFDKGDFFLFLYSLSNNCMQMNTAIERVCCEMRPELCISLRPVRTIHYKFWFSTWTGSSVLLKMLV